MEAGPQAQAASQAEIEGKPEGEVSSFAKSLFMGEIHEEMVFPYPKPKAEEQAKVKSLIAAAHEIAGSVDHRKAEEDRWIGDKTIKALGDAGLCGLYVDER